MAIVQWSGLQLWHNVVKRSIFIKFFYLIYIMVMAKWLALLLFIYVDHLMRDRSQCCLCYFTLITGCGIGKPLFIFLSHWLWHCGHLCCYSSTFFKKTGQSRPLFCLFLFFSSYNFNNTNWKSIDGVLGIGTRGRRMVGTDETTELWRPPEMMNVFICVIFNLKMFQIFDFSGQSYKRSTSNITSNFPLISTLES